MTDFEQLTLFVNKTEQAGASMAPTFYISANGRMYRDRGYGLLCTGWARSGFPQKCPRRGAIPCGNVCLHCENHLMMSTGTYCCGAYVSFCAKTGRQNNANYDN